MLALTQLSCSDYGLEPRTDGEGPLDDDDGITWIDDAEVPPACGEGVPKAPAIALDESCLEKGPPVGSLTPVVEWQSEALSLTDPTFTHPYVMPVVANLDDDDGDGTVTAEDMPEIVYTSFELSVGYGTRGVLRGLSGDGSGETLAVRSFTFGGTTWDVSGMGGVAVGDLLNDGSPAIVTIVLPSGASDTDSLGNVAVLAADGTPRWVETSRQVPLMSYPSLADLDADGESEIIVGSLVLDAHGGLVWQGYEGTGGPADGYASTLPRISFAADVDVDGDLEVVAGNTLYDSDGAILWVSDLSDGYSAVGNFDADDQAEIVTVSYTLGKIRLFEHDGSEVWTSLIPGGFGGPPTVADFDGDGQAEIGAASRDAYTVFETDGSILWTNQVRDYSSAMTGSSVFDFDGDGSAEVVYADEYTLYVFAGATGNTLLAESGHAHGTAGEYPVIADVDNDGEAEIILGSTDNNPELCNGKYCWDGITVMGDLDHSWMPARRIWNQHAYSISNVDEDGGIPTSPEVNWLVWNTFRAGAAELGTGKNLPDLLPADPEMCIVECALDVVYVYVPVGNAGVGPAPSFQVTFDREGADDTHELVGGLASTQATVLGPFAISSAGWGTGELVVLVDDPDAVLECRENNNAWSLGPWPCDEP